LRDEILHSTCNVRLTEWERLAEHDEHAPVTVRVYVPGGVPELVEGESAPLSPPPPQAAIASTTRDSTVKVANTARLRPARPRIRPWVAQARPPEAARAIVQRSQAQGRVGRKGGKGLYHGVPSDDAAVGTVTMTLVEELLKVTETGETVQLAPEGAPAQVKVAF
jgi:hypothetical protein